MQDLQDKPNNGKLFGGGDNYEKSMSTPNLDKFGKDYTLLAIKDLSLSEGQKILSPITDREDEIQSAIKTLMRKKKNNVLLVGYPGVGKTAIVEGLAQKIVTGNVPTRLKDYKVIELNLTSVIAGTKYRGEFEERMEGIVHELENNSNIILFIDEIHTILGAGSAQGGQDVSNILKPALAKGLKLIGATTFDEARKYFDKDAALSRRFTKVAIDEPSIESTITILNNVKKGLEETHKVVYSTEAVRIAANYCKKYIRENKLPDSAISILDVAGAARSASNKFVYPSIVSEMQEKVKELAEKKEESVKKTDYEEASKIKSEIEKLNKSIEKEKESFEKSLIIENNIIEAQDIIYEISSVTKLPIEKLNEKETDVLINLEDKLNKEVIGQSEAISLLCKAVKRQRVFSTELDKPLSFFFIGPTGVGKTELAKCLTRSFFNSEELIKLDMSEYSEFTSISKLIGSAPGFVGYDEGGQLTEKVNKKPYSVILFDEIEKAHPTIFSLLLQVLDEGVLTDGQGRVVDFKNTIILFTSNIGVKEASMNKSSVGFISDESNKFKDTVYKALKKAFSPEFLNRLNSTIIFNQLSKEDIEKIVEISLSKSLGKLTRLGFTVEITDKTKQFIIDKGYSTEYGVRPLVSAIQKYVEEPIADSVLRKPESLKLIVDVLEDNTVVLEG